MGYEKEFQRVYRESSLNRIRSKLSTHDCGTISAFKSAGWWADNIGKYRRNEVSGRNDKAVIQKFLKWAADEVGDGDAKSHLTYRNVLTSLKQEGYSATRQRGLAYRFNRMQNDALLADLREKYGVTAIDGHGQEEDPSNPGKERDVPENSFFVCDEDDLGTLKKDLLELGIKYAQWGVTFIPAGQQEGQLLECATGNVDAPLNDRGFSGTKTDWPFYSAKNGKNFKF